MVRHSREQHGGEHPYDDRDAKMQGHEDRHAQEADVPAQPETPREGTVVSSSDADGRGGTDAAGPARVLRVVAADYLVTVNPVDGSEIEPCPPGALPADPRKLPRDARPGQGGAAPAIPLVERDEERERLRRLLAQGRTVRLTGPSGAGRSTLLDAVAEDVADLAPDGVVRLSGYRRTPDDLLYDLFAAVHEAPLHRPSRRALRAALRGVGAVVVLDDLEFGGAALAELLASTPECAYLLSATPGAPAPSPDSYVEELHLSGLSRNGSLELLEHAVRRPLTDEEADWAVDLWCGNEGLPLRFVQAGALLRQRAGSGAALPAEGAPTVMLLASALSGPARETLRFAIALDGELPAAEHLPALVGDPHAGEAVAEITGVGLATAAGAHHRLAAGVAQQLRAAGYGEGAAVRAQAAAQHYAWWASDPSADPARVAAEADALLAAVQGARRGGNAATALLLARAAAPVLAATLRWSVWDRMLRGGQEAARATGEIAEEAYFHHELGILALCAGDPQRAQAELEASIGLRGVLADQSGTVAGRRALTLAADRLSGAAPGAPLMPSGPSPARSGGGPAADPGEEPAPVPPAPVPPPPVEAVTGGEFAEHGTYAYEAAVPAAGDGSAPEQDEGRDTDTLVTSAVSRTAAPHGTGTADKEGGRTGHRGGPGHPARRRLAMSSARRNVVAAGAGALLAAVLGTFVTLGSVSDGEVEKPADRVKPDTSATRQDDDSDLTADRPGDGGDGGSSGTGSTSRPQQPGPTGEAPNGSEGPGDSAAPSDGASTPGGDASSSEGTSDGSSGGPGGGDSGSGGGSGSSGSGGSGSTGSSGGSGSTGGSSGGSSGGSADGGTSDGGTSDGGTDSGGGTGDPSTGGGTGDPSTGGSADGGTSDGGTTDGGSSTSGGTSGGGSASPPTA